ncbi:PDZ domain-containing protein 4-like isoform X2 [Hippocampus zosterae]|uniref:PDZ domain-containing protein 4-like isoform X2 n=1 Tax=Hippocampus zosterae TaxID=109293 RepID=UPI00223D2B0C|nr:PDZ domain-containing protein 4-like isoform X2 [Hippocampus zosterae]
MCVVRRSEEHYKVMYQIKGRRRSRLLLDKPPKSQEPLQRPVPNHKSHRRKGAIANTRNRSSGTSVSSLTMVALPPEHMDNTTQTDVSFQWPAITPVLPCLMGEYWANEFKCVFDDGDDYLEVSHHEVDRPDELEYEEVTLYKSSQQEKLGLTVCYRTDDEDNMGIYVGEVNPNSTAAKNGRIREGDRILQINGVDIGSREEAVAILSREDSGNFSLLLARPDIEEDQLGDGVTRQNFILHHCHSRTQRGESNDAEKDDDEEGNAAEAPVLLPPLLHLASLLSNSQDLDSGLGRTDESSEHDLLGGFSSACNTDATNTPGSTPKFCLGHSPRLSPLPSPGVGPSPKITPSPGHVQGETPPPFSHLQVTSDTLTALDVTEGGATQNHAHHKLQLHSSPMNMMATMSSLTEDECQWYQELLKIRYHCKRQPRNVHGEEEQEEVTNEEVPSPSVADMNCNVNMTECEMALIEEELRHLEFKCRNCLRAQKMQQLRLRYMKALMMEEETDEADFSHTDLHDSDGVNNDDTHRHELSAINELPERSTDGKDSTSAYGSCESCHGTPLVSTVRIPPLRDEEALTAPPSHWERCQSKLGSGSWDSDVINTLPSKFRTLSNELGSPSRRAMAEGGHGSRTGITLTMPCGGSAESSPFLAQRRQRAKALEPYHSCIVLPSDGLLEPLDWELVEDRRAGIGSSERAISVSNVPCGPEGRLAPSCLVLAQPLTLAHSSPTATGQHLEWKVKIRSDRTRYMAKRPVRDRLLKARAMQIREERGCTTTDDDAAASEMKQGRYWSKEERKQHLLRAREYRQRREFMMQSRVDYLKGDRDAVSSADGTIEFPVPVHNDNVVPLSQKKMSRKRNCRILNNWNTIQELLAHGSCSYDGKKIFNPLLSFTNV